MKNSPRFQAVLAAMLLGWVAAANAQQADSGDNATDKRSAADTAFIEKAAEGGMAEIEMGRTALAKSNDYKVKALAQRIVDDHTKANDALKALAQSEKVSFPSHPSPDAQKENDKLQAMKPAAFDATWSKAMVNDHQEAIKLFTTESKNTKDDELQQFVKDNLPTLKSHLAAAQQLVAVPQARDQAMDQASKSMVDAMDNTPSTGTTTTATPATKSAMPAASPAPASGAKH